MKNKLLAPMTAIVASALLVPAPAAWAIPASEPEGSRSGGAPATPLLQGPGGGALAPAADLEAGAEALTAQAGESPEEAVLGQEPTPTVPEGEQQPGEEQPAGDEEPTSSDETAAPDEADRAAAADSGAAAESAATGEADQGGSLPITGLGLAALAAIGLGMAIAGVALRSRGGAKAE